MVIQCPECNTRYNISEDRLGPAGKKMRCARCKAVFFATPIEEDAPELSSDASETFAPEEPAAEAPLESSFDLPEDSTPAVDDDPFASAFDEEAQEEAESGFDFSSFDSSEEDGFVQEIDGPSPDDGYDDGFVQELDEEDSVFDFAFNSAETQEAEAALENVDALLSEEDDTLEEMEDDASIAEALSVKPQRNPMAAVKGFILLLLLIIIGGVGYLMYTDGVDGPMNFLSQLLDNLG